jgi:hypothetical protein
MKHNDGPAPQGEAPAADAHQGTSEQSAGSGAPLRRIAVGSIVDDVASMIGRVVKSS